MEERYQHSRGEKLLILETSSWTPHLETGLEIALSEAARGVAVRYTHIGESLDFVEGQWIRPSGWRSAGFLPSSPHRIGMKIAQKYSNRHGLNATYEVVNAPKPALPDEVVKALQDLSSFDDLMSLKVGDLQVGRAVVGSLSLLLLDSRPSPVLHRDLVEALISSYFHSREIASYYLRVEDPDCVAVCNGRTAATRAVADLADERGVDVRYWERGSSVARYFFEAYSPHNVYARAADIVSAWNDAVDSNRKLATELSELHFEKRRSGRAGYSRAFAAHQKEGLLAITRAGEDRKIVSFFTSSEDEFAAFRPDFGSFGSQHSVVQSLIRLAELDDFLLIIRVHPNIVNKSRADQERWTMDAFEGGEGNFLFLSSFSEVSTYEILHVADLVITAGSTVSFEAAALGKRVICVAESLPKALVGFCTVVKNEEELRTAIGDESLPIADSEITLAVGHYFETFGKEYEYYVPDDADNGRFLSVRLNRSIRHRLRRSWRKH